MEKQASVEKQDIGIEELRKVKGIGPKAIERIKGQLEVSEEEANYISEYDKDIHLDLNKIHLGDCLELMNGIPSGSIDVTVTSPPYFNAREYSIWDTFEEYMVDMKKIFKEVYRVTGNHRHLILNVGDVVSKGATESKWASRKYPLGAYFTVMMEELGFTFVDDFIWDKGEPQSKRHLGNPPYPFYQYPVNAYEHIFVFVKNELDMSKVACPDCEQKITRSNSQTDKGVQSWECSNVSCPTKSKSGRGKRFSKRSVMMNDYQTKENEIPKEFVDFWRKDIVKFSPVIKINSKGDNTFGHTAPFPEIIPEMAIRYYSGVGDVVLDPFIGSGTTAIVAKELCRNFIGIEMDETYHKLATERVAKHVKE